MLSATTKTSVYETQLGPILPYLGLVVLFFAVLAGLVIVFVRLHRAERRSREQERAGH